MPSDEDEVAAFLGEKTGDEDEEADTRKKATEKADDEESDADEEAEKQRAKKAESENEEEAEDQDGDKDGAAELSDDTALEWQTKDGSKYTATVAELKNGYLRQSDYTKKTQDLSGRFVEANTKAHAEWVNRFSAVDDLFNEVTEFLTGGTIKPPDESLLQTDPDEFHRQDAMHRLQGQKVDALLKKRAEFRAKAEAEGKQAQVAWEKEHAAKLYEALPILTHPVKGKLIRTALAEYLRGYGFTDDEMKGLKHSAQIQFAIDGMRYRNIEKRRKVTQEKVKNTTRMVRSGSRASSKNEDRAERTRRLADRAKSTQRLDDWALVMEPYAT